MRVDVVIPVLNEAHVLERSVATLREFCARELRHDWRIVIVDNGSTDGTAEVGRSLAGRFPDVALMHLDLRGRGRALREAWTRSEADIVCYMDVDLSTRLRFLPPLIESIAGGGYDLATGSRLLPESRTRRSWNRELISRIYNLLVRAMLRTRFSDAQCGFKAASREAVRRIVPQIEDQSWFFDTELLVLAEKQGLRIKDLPVEWVEDDDSRVKIVRTAWDDIKGLWRLRRTLARGVPAPVGAPERSVS
jgi:glycosyltransferase involved in cell wall biosynthesis